MRITTERRLERLEAADAPEGVVHVALDTLPEGEDSVGRLMSEEEWEAVHCAPERRR